LYIVYAEILNYSGDPKTSEYAFFKKLKKDASLRFSSAPGKKDDDSLSSKKPEFDDSFKGWFNLNYVFVWINSLIKRL